MLEQTQVIPIAPMFYNFAGYQAHNMNIGYGYSLAGGRDAKKLSLMGTVKSIATYHPVALSDQVLFYPLTVREAAEEDETGLFPALGSGRKARRA